MICDVDNLWATPSGLHLRVTVWPDDRRWRRRFDETVLWADVPDEVMTLLIGHWMDTQPLPEPDDIPLF